MRELPPQELVATLERLRLATAEQVAQMGRRVGRLARDLPRFDSVWIDALAQARVLTPFQAAELNAGRSERLRLGPYLLCDRLAHPLYVACYRAKNVDSDETVRLAIVEDAGPQADAIVDRLRSLVTAGARTHGDDDPKRDVCRSQPRIRTGVRDPEPEISDSKSQISDSRFRTADSRSQISDFRSQVCGPESEMCGPLPASDVGVDGRRVFVAEPWIDGQTAAQWMVHHGRFPPEIVLEIARAMLPQLIALEERGLCHGDVSASSLILTDAGRVALAMPGLRGILRPEEGYAHADLLPEAFDCMAPERVAAGVPPDASTEIYACGCVWWHLLCGRPPLSGGDSLTRLRAAQAGGICDVRRYAPDAPPPLAAAISACVETEPSRRPESLARLAAMLGSPTGNGKAALADCLARTCRPAVHWTTTTRAIGRNNRTPLWLAGAVCCLAAIVAIFWPGRHDPGLAGSPPSNATATTNTPPSVQKLEPNSLPSPFGRAVGGEGHSQPANTQTATHQPPLSREVLPASFQQPMQPPPDVVLAADAPINATSLATRDGQCVRAAPGRRAVVLVPETGLIVDKENVRFQNIDFAWSPAARSTAGREASIVRVLAAHAEFRGCSFRCLPQAAAEGRSFADVPVSAITWVHPVDPERADVSLPSGQIRLLDCLLTDVAAGLDCRTLGTHNIELMNTLCLGGGPLLRLDHCPHADESLSLSLSQFTLRGGGPLIECFMPEAVRQSGEISVFAAACVFAPRNGEPLVRCRGPAAPESLTGLLRWTGQGSLVTPETPIVTSRQADAREVTVDESSLAVAGLVRSEVGFAGRLSSDPAASRAIRWQAPLRSGDAPGVDPAPLPCPGR
jgi:serine/threonine protein kinase